LQAVHFSRQAVQNDIKVGSVDYVWLILGLASIVMRAALASTEQPAAVERQYISDAAGKHETE
jgi:hypothetical protein